MRNCKADSMKGNWDSSDMERAIQAVLKNNMSVRKAAETYNVKRSTLQDKLKGARFSETEVASYKPYADLIEKVQRRFTNTEGKTYQERLHCSYGHSKRDGTDKILSRCLRCEMVCLGLK